MKRALWTDFWREIRKNKGRFISIFFIVALGAAFFSGIRSAQSDMKISADTYYDETNLMDIRILSTLGLTEDDIAEISSVEGVKRVEGAYALEALCDTGEVELTLRLVSRTTGINTAAVDRGRLPAKEDECLVDTAFLTKSGYDIGDTIQLQSGTDTDLSESLKFTELKIVGVGRLPYYMDLSRGTGAIGDGSIDCFAVLSPAAFTSPAFTEIYVALEGAAEEMSYEDAYDSISEKVAGRLEGIAEGACLRRYHVLKADLEQQLADAEKQVADGEAALADGRDQLDDGSRQLSEAERMLLEQEQELQDAKAQIEDGEAGMESARQQIADGEAQLAQAGQMLAEKEQELQGAEEQLAQGKAEYASGKAEYESGAGLLEIAQKRLGELQAEMEDYKAQLDQLGITTTPVFDAMKENLDKLQKEVDERSGQVAAARQQLDAAAAQIASAETQIAEGRSQLTAAKAQLEQKSSELVAAKEQLKDGEARLEESKQLVSDGESQIADGKEQLKEKKQELSDAEQEFQDSHGEALQQLADAREQIDKGKKTLEELEVPEWYVLDRNKIESYVTFGQDAQRISNIGKVFPVMFFLVAALVSLTAMTRMIEEQRTQIGTYKALGYGNGIIALKYFCYAMLATIGGSVLGVVVGEKVLPWVIMKAYGMLYTGLPYYLTPINWEQALQAVIASAACTGIATLAACWRELRAKPSELMRPEAPKGGKRVFLEHIGPLWRRLNFTQKSTVRNLVRYKKRFFMTIFGIGGCMALMLVGFGVQDSILTVAKNQYVNIFTYNSAITLNTKADGAQKEELSEAVKEYPGMRENMELYSQNVDLEAGDSTKSATLYVPADLNKVFEFMKFRDRKSGEEYPFPENGAALTEKTAKMLGVGVGDTVVIKKGETSSAEVRVETIVENYVYHYIFLTPSLYKELYGEAPVYNQMLMNYSDTSEGAEKQLGQRMMELDAVSGVTFIRDLEESIDKMLQSLNMVIYVLITSAGLLAFVVLYNLNNINITERQRELATIKVLGFYNLEVAEYVYRENVLLTLIGMIAGVGMGIVLHQFVIQTVEVDAMMFGRKIDWPSFVYSALLTLIFAVFVNFIMYYRLRKIDMIESLKSVE